MRISDWSSDVCSSDLLADIFDVEHHQTPGALVVTPRTVTQMRSCRLFQCCNLAAGFGASDAPRNSPTAAAESRAQPDRSACRWGCRANHRTGWPGSARRKAEIGRAHV